MKIAITGGAGFVGSALTKKFLNSGHEVLILDRVAPKQIPIGVVFRKTDLVNDIPLKEYLECEAVVHLAGANIFGRWTPKYKKLILSSRVDTARALIKTVKIAGRGPKAFISASAVGYYGDGGERELDESAPNGTDFLAGVCHEWEAVLAEANDAGMRSVSVRTGIVLGPGGGMLAKLVPIFRWGLGGRMGHGRQWFSWIHMDDLLHVYETVTTDSRFSGPVNASSPRPIRNNLLAKALGRALHRPALLPVPRFILRLVLGELGDIVLMSQKVIPQKLMDAGFHFTYVDIDEALRKSVS